MVAGLIVYIVVTGIIGVLFVKSVMDGHFDEELKEFDEENYNKIVERRVRQFSVESTIAYTFVFLTSCVLLPVAGLKTLFNKLTK